MVKRATSLFNSFYSNVAKQVARFLLLVFSVPLGVLKAIKETLTNSQPQSISVLQHSEGYTTLWIHQTVKRLEVHSFKGFRTVPAFLEYLQESGAWLLIE